MTEHGGSAQEFTRPVEARSDSTPATNLSLNAPITERTEGVSPVIPVEVIPMPQVSEGRPRLDTAPGSEKMVTTKGQSELMKKMLGNLKLDIPVSETVDVRDASFFTDRLTHAYTGMQDIPTAILAASEPAEAPVSVLLVTPKEEESGLLVDDTGKFWSDSFWMIEDGVMRYVRPSEPVPLDHLSVEFDSERPDIAATLSEQQANSHRFDALTRDKQRVKEILHGTGIRVPDGTYFELGDEEEVAVQVTEALAELGDEVVLKKNNGESGNHVTAWKTTEPSAHDHIGELLAAPEYQDTGFILEERIRPLPNAMLAKKLNEHFEERDPTRSETITADDVDYNIRVITTVGNDPEVVDAEIRFNLKADKDTFPVNISKGALVSRMDAIEDPEVVARIYDTAKRVTQAIYAEIGADEEQLACIAGIDLMLDENGEVVVIEGNGFRSGGFATLTKEDKKPLLGITQTLIPSYVPVLQTAHDQRPTALPERFRRVEANYADQLTLFEVADAMGDYDKAVRIAYGIAQKYLPDHYNHWVRSYFDMRQGQVEDQVQLFKYMQVYPPLDGKDPLKQILEHYKAETENREHEEQGIEKVALTVAIGEEVRAEDFSLVEWGHEGKERNGYAWTTHPVLLKAMLEGGPHQLDAFLRAGEEISMTTIMLPAKPKYEGPAPKNLRDATEINIDARSGLMTIRKPKDSRLLAGEVGGVTSYRVENALYSEAEDAPYAYNDPTDLYPDLRPFVIYSELDQQVQPMIEAWNALGFSHAEDGQSYTLPLPTEFATRMEDFRKMNDGTGIYFPQIKLLSTGRIEFDEYLQMYAEKKHPVGINIMRYYKHDIATAHIKSFMVYGDMFMDMIARYADTSLKGDAQVHEDASHIIDVLTNYLGNTKVDKEALSHAEPQFTEIITALREDETLDQLALISWMQECGLITQAEEITAESLKDAFVMQARERFGL